MSKRVLATVMAMALAASLAGCGSAEDSENTSGNGTATSASSAPSATPSVGSSPVDVLVSDEGMPTLGEDGDGLPVLEFPDSPPPEQLQLSVLEEGDGAEVTADSLVMVNYEGQVWQNGKPFDSSFSRGAPAVFTLSGLVDGWKYGLEGRHVGDKLILSVPPELGYGPQGGQPSAGIEADDTIVFYLEVVNAWDATSAGEADAAVEMNDEDLPVEITGDLGRPVAELKVKDGQAAPTAASTQIIARGSGEEVAEDGSGVVVAYAAISWDGELSLNTWEQDDDESESAESGPTTLPLGQGTITDSLAGIPVGSRVLLLIPESDDSSGSTLMTPAMAYVIDILGYVPAARG